MRKLLLFLIALASIAFGVCSPAHADCVAVPGIPQSGTGCAVSYPPAPSSGGPARDGSAVGANSSNASTTTPTLTTSNGSGIIYCGAGTNATSVTSITATGLTFTQRSSISSFGFTILAGYSAPYSTNFSGTITVNVATANFTTIDCQAYSGVSGFDGSPATNTSTTATKTTSLNNDVVVAVNSLSSGSDTAGSGWSLVGTSANFMLMEDQVNVSAGTYTSTTGGGLTNGSIVDALH
jgi:hypothetical protein